LPGLINITLESNKIDPNTAITAQNADTLKESQEQYLAIAFLVGTDQNRYGKLLLKDLKNDHMQGKIIPQRP
jgi:hypothetical protein